MPDGNGSYYIVPQTSSTSCLDLQTGVIAAGKNIALWNYNLGKAQRWHLLQASTPTQTTKATISGCYRGWGICKGAKNPVAAGVFLRYYLDVNNYDTASAFITPEAESFFFKLTSSGSITDKFYYMVGGSDGLATATSHKKIIGIATGDPGQVKASLDALKNTIDSDVNDLNNYIAKQK